MSRENEKPDGSETIEAETNSPQASKPEDIRNFPEWLDLQLENIVVAYDDFSTSNSRRGFYGRGK